MIQKTLFRLCCATREFFRYALVFVLGLGPLQAAEAITGAVAVAGNVSVSSTPSATTVLQSSDKAILECRTLNIPSGHRLDVIQPSNQAILLARVLGGSKSILNGPLSATGHVVITNASGFVVGSGFVADVNSLNLTTRNISNDDFMSGKYKFSGTGGGEIVITGDIELVRPGSWVGFVAEFVEHQEGKVLAAPFTRLLVAGAEGFTVDLDGDGFSCFQVDESKATSPLKVQMREAAKIDAQNGYVLLTVQDVEATVASAINMKGTVSAQRVEEGEGGVIRLVGGAGSTATVSGTLDASSPAGKGGTVDATAENLKFTETAKVDVSGAKGGGEMHIGGYVKNPPTAPVPESKRVELAEGSTFDLDATDNGDGGHGEFWAAEKLVSEATVRARGGPNGGNGGYLDTSARKVMEVFRMPTARLGARISGGKPGTRKYDPQDIYIVDALPAEPVIGEITYITLAQINTDLGDANVLISTAALEGAALGDVFVQTPLVIDGWGGDYLDGDAIARALTITADGNITFSDGCGITVNSNADVGLITTAGSIIIPELVTVSAGKESTLTLQSAGNVLLTTGATHSGSGAINVVSEGGDVDIGPIEVEAGSQGLIDVTAQIGSISLSSVASNSTENGGVQVVSAANVNFTPGQTITASGAGAITFQAPTLIITNTVTNTGSGTVTFTSTSLPDEGVPLIIGRGVTNSGTGFINFIATVDGDNAAQPEININANLVNTSSPPDGILDEALLDFLAGIKVVSGYAPLIVGPGGGVQEFTGVGPISMASDITITNNGTNKIHLIGGSISAADEVEVPTLLEGTGQIKLTEGEDSATFVNGVDINAGGDGEPEPEADVAEEAAEVVFSSDIKTVSSTVSNEAQVAVADEGFGGESEIDFGGEAEVDFGGDADVSLDEGGFDVSGDADIAVDDASVEDGPGEASLDFGDEPADESSAPEAVDEAPADDEPSADESADESASEAEVEEEAPEEEDTSEEDAAESDDESESEGEDSEEDDEEEDEEKEQKSEEASLTAEEARDALVESGGERGAATVAPSTPASAVPTPSPGPSSGAAAPTGLSDRGSVAVSTPTAATPDSPTPSSGGNSSTAGGLNDRGGGTETAPTVSAPSISEDILSNQTVNDTGTGQ